MKLETWELGRIKPYGNNPRKNDGAVDAVVESMKQCGYCDPIEVDENGVILSGHTRLKAMIKLGRKEAEVIILDGLTEEQKKKYRILANKTGEIALWDTDLLKMELDGLDFGGFDFGFDIEKDDAKEDDFDVDAAIESAEEPITKMGDIWTLGRHRLMCGDSTDTEAVQKLMNGQVADMLLTDPPYNVDYGEKAEDINKYGYNFSDRHIENDNMESTAFVAFLEKAFGNAKSALKQGGAFYIWHASVTLYEFETALKNAGIQTRQQLIWNKNSLVIGRQDYQWKHEPCLYGWMDGAGHYFVDDRKQTTVFEDKPPEFKKMKKDELVALLQEIYSDKSSMTVIAEDRPSNSPEHPTMKPVKLMARLIKNSSKQSECVLDLFGGSGSTLIACEQLNRSCFMMEYEPKYCDVIVRRWEKLTGETAVLQEA